MDNRKKYWFPAKTYGWGWGLPSAWQGWLVFAGYIAALAVLGNVFPPKNEHAAFVIGAGVLTLLLLAICWLKGEPPRWRSGGRN